MATLRFSDDFESGDFSAWTFASASAKLTVGGAPNPLMFGSFSAECQYLVGATVYFQHQINNYIILEDKAVNRAYSNVDFGVGIRVLKGDQTGFSFTEELTPKAMKLAAQTAANIADSSQHVEASPLKLHNHPDYYTRS